MHSLFITMKVLAFTDTFEKKSWNVFQAYLVNFVLKIDTFSIVEISSPAGKDKTVSYQ